MSQAKIWRVWMVLVLGLLLMVGCGGTGDEPVAVESGSESTNTEGYSEGDVGEVNETDEADEADEADEVDEADEGDETEVSDSGDVMGCTMGEELVTERPLAEMAPTERDGYYFEQPPADFIDTSKSYYALMETENGSMCIELFADDAPLTVNNFVYLATQGFYDNTTFHRVIQDFMAQGGDPSGTGRGGPGYSFADEFEADNQFDKRGVLAMANAGPNTNGSQFFITFVPTPHLNFRHTIFGQVVDGDDVLGAIAIKDPRQPGSGDILKQVRIFVQ
ncbi:MAG TPA: peptidylprolyl isomerase [Anaerolineae bacterium]|nr:peptidylprolyl isomerase [Anaerolineae bacterium]